MHLPRTTEAIVKSAHLCRSLIAALVLVLAATCTVAAAHPDVTTPSRVSVHYVHPHKFTESRQKGFGHEYDHGNYLEKLKAFLIKQAAPMLAPGQHLSITITDIDLAGGYEPWLGPQWDDVRFMRDIYPPRFDLSFKLTGANGQVIRQGKRQLRGLGYLQSQPSLPGNSDPLHYDKGLLEHWLRKGPQHW